MKKVNVIVFLMLALLFTACSSISKITQTLTNLQRLEFKLENVNDFAVAGIKLNDKKSADDFSITDGLKLTQAFMSKSFPARFILNVAAKNPNDGTGGSKQTGATITSFDWQLYIDDVPTIKGNIANPITVPGTGQTTIIPIVVELDLYKFFKDKGYDGILNLALALGGVEGSAARLKLDAKPTVQTDFGPLEYPGRITIVDTKFSS